MAITIRDLTQADIDRLVELNNAAVPAVPQSDASELTRLLELSDHAFGVIDGEPDADGGAENAALKGFVLCMTSGSGYLSENYRFFHARGTDFLYVDRIVVDEELRGRGIGRLLYDRVFRIARSEGRSEVTCEVNVEPPNPRSLAFHARLGFVEVARQGTKNGTVEVALLAVGAEATVVGSQGRFVAAASSTG